MDRCCKADGPKVCSSIDWVAAKELQLSYHNIEIIWFLVTEFKFLHNNGVKGCWVKGFNRSESFETLASSQD